MTLQIHSFVPFSYANGPGCRATIWVQGCSIGCDGCFNQQTHAFDTGRGIEVEELLAVLHTLTDRVEGITVSGGEPLQQRPALTALLRRLKETTNLSIILLTGFTWAEVQSMVASDGKSARTPISAPRPEQCVETPAWASIPLAPTQGFLRYVDVLIAGPYHQYERLARGLRGSSNKTIHLLTNRYSLQDIEGIPEAEAIIAPDGRIILSGVDPLCLT